MSEVKNVSFYRQDLLTKDLLGKEQQGKTLVIACPKQGAPELLYFGDALPKTTDLASVYLSQQAAIPQGMMDKPTPMSLIPEAGRGWLQTPAVEAIAEDRPVWAACWSLVAVDEKQSGFVIRLEDKVAQLSVALNIGLLPSGVLRQQLTLTNQGQANVTVQRLACTLP
ncbi:MAG: alpha-galactosidase, partial [Gammaproteobacteria bacterium]|nr:alpha-galactosidase [Gammaproteobacteria bacterium]